MIKVIAPLNLILFSVVIFFGRSDCLSVCLSVGLAIRYEFASRPSESDWWRIYKYGLDALRSPAAITRELIYVCPSGLVIEKAIGHDSKKKHFNDLTTEPGINQ